MARRNRTTNPAPEADTSQGAVTDAVEASQDTATDTFVDDQTGDTGEGDAPVAQEAAPTETQESVQEIVQENAVDDNEDTPAAGIGDNSKDGRERNRAKIFSQVGKLGRDAGQGKKSLVALCETLCHAAENGLVDPDDAEKLYKKFRDESAKAAGNFAAEEQDANSLKANASKLRQLLNVSASWGKLAPSDGMFESPWDLFELARDQHVQALKGEDKKNLRSKSTYESLVNIARRQLKDEQRGVIMTEEQVRDELFVDDTDKKDKTALDLVVSAYLMALKAQNGKADTPTKAGRAGLADGNLEQALLHMREVIHNIDPETLKKIDAKNKPATTATPTEGENA